MKNFKSLFILLLISFSIFSCFEDNDDTPIKSSSINDFVWKGMNLRYLYKSNIPDLADNRFATDAQYQDYLTNAGTPEELFESLIFERATVDRFSWIVDDYFELERQFQGTTGTNGMEFGLFASPNSTTEGFGVIRLVLPNSPADNMGLKRGDIFYGIDGNRLTNNNLPTLLGQDTYTLNLGIYNDNGTADRADDSIDPINRDVTLSKVQYTENPIFLNSIINVGGENVGYLMYNAFTRGSENGLNTVFADFASNNIQHLIIDLRYNPGGSVGTTTFLASMITGQFNGDLFERLIFNENFQSDNRDLNFTNQLPNGSTINSVNLNKIYALTSSRSASASEGLINGLVPYIDVIKIGDSTTGKTQLSRTLYDSPNFQRQGANPNHTYAMQPLIGIGVNKNGEDVPGTGLVPSLGFEYVERPLDYGVLGDRNEPMLAIALADIEGSTTKLLDITKSSQAKTFKLIKDSNDFIPNDGGMIID
ncbi:S41 family peptidase [uncultured Algibacter sp.]|uniref:S41 family peptidase n=1 Tax=uncultured Algibacter sp. TaxID=298659 RepID=UPI0032168815